jgi:predicted transcriptional regulator
MSKLLDLAELLNLRFKLPEESLRLLYLRDVWGLEQSELAKYVGKSQGYISVHLKKTRTKRGAIPFTIDWEVDELKMIQFLPRELLTDNQVIAFFMDILQLDINHPFFNFYNHPERNRILALHSLGVRQKRIVELFTKTQPAVSMMINSQSLKEHEQVGRYDKTAKYTFKPRVEVPKNKFIPAGGSTFVW